MKTIAVQHKTSIFYNLSQFSTVPQQKSFNANITFWREEEERGVLQRLLLERSSLNSYACSAVEARHC